MPASRILIADDEASIRKVLSAMLRRSGHEVEAVTDGAEAMDRLGQERFHLLVTDLRMPRIGGIELLAWCHEHVPGLPVVILTAYGTVDTAVEALKLGAHDYVAKPFDQDEIERVVAKALATGRGARREAQGDPRARSALVGRTEAMREVRALVDRAASSPTPVLVLGESGTGKALVARAIHESSDRRDGPFLHVDCGAIPAGQAEGELFGHEHGSPAGGSRPGRLELADGGTLVLDEVSELPPEVQARLVRVLAEHAFERVGGGRAITVDVRVVTASRVDLATAVAAGRFREDLRARLAGLVIRLPPLRERIEDIPLLAEAFAKRHQGRRGGRVAGMDAEALEALQAWSWPGNVRELEDVLERALLLAGGETVRLGDLEGIPGAPPAAPEDEDLGLHDFLRVHLARLERDRIRQALESEGGNVTRTARRLGISRKGLQLKMKEYGLRDPSPGEGGP